MQLWPMDLVSLKARGTENCPRWPLCRPPVTAETQGSHDWSTDENKLPMFGLKTEVFSIPGLINLIVQFDHLGRMDACLFGQMSFKIYLQIRDSEQYLRTDPNG